jgi:hypothetical protein
LDHEGEAMGSRQRPHHAASPWDTYITDEGQMLAIACLIRVCECSGNDVAKLANVEADQIERGMLGA